MVMATPQDDYADYQIACGMRNAMAIRIADNATHGRLPDSISTDLYNEYKATVVRLRDGIREAAQ